MSTAVRSTTIALAVVLAAGAGYWAARSRHTATSVEHAGHDPAIAPAGTGTGGKRGILYYRNPMGFDTSPVPKKDAMGMDYIPVYADEKADDGEVVAVSAARVQTMGVRIAEVELRTVDAAIRASGRIAIDERNQAVIAPRFEGWIERLHVQAVGDRVEKGQPLFTTYSPELQSTGEELRVAERLASQSAASDPLASESARRLADATRIRLRNLEVAGQVGARQVLHAPLSGVVLEKEAVQGRRFMPGDVLFRIADLSKVWIIADIHEADLAHVHAGQGAQITLDAFPGRSFNGRIGYLYPTLNADTRTTPARIELDNPEGLLRPGMFASITLAVGDVTPKTVVPTSAIIDDGRHQIVLRALGDGRFKPRPVTLGQRGRDVVEVLQGVSPGDRVVVSANFLIDSESQLRAALADMIDPTAESHAYGSNTHSYEAEGTLVAVDLQAGRVTLTHDGVPALQWPAMSTDFKFSDPDLVKNIGTGTAVRFAFRAGKPGEYIVTRIEPVATGMPVPATRGHQGH
ncbi:MAG: efflux RND transporter periplasmic adaptor subunit [Gammaproteobacteria bacterium]|nr:efflux RND transporter periplasmic adaptor subunit [Gammaproteobacteria bacterium]